MAYSHYFRCPQCNAIGSTENRTPLWLLFLGRTNVALHCSACGFKKSYYLLSAAAFERLAVADEVAAQELSLPSPPASDKNV